MFGHPLKFSKLLAILFGLSLFFILIFCYFWPKYIHNNTHLWGGYYLLKSGNDWGVRTLDKPKGNEGCSIPEDYKIIRWRYGAKRVLIIGNSLSYGAPFLPENSPPPLTAWKLVEATWRKLESKGVMKADFLNLSSPGATSLALGCLARSAGVLKPDLVFFQPTNNDNPNFPLRGWQGCIGLAPLGLRQTLWLLFKRPLHDDTCLSVDHRQALDPAIEAAAQLAPNHSVWLVLPPVANIWPHALGQVLTPHSARLWISAWNGENRESIQTEKWLEKITSSNNDSISSVSPFYRSAMNFLAKREKNDALKQMLLANNLNAGDMCFTSPKDFLELQIKSKALGLNTLDLDSALRKNSGSNFGLPEDFPPSDEPYLNIKWMTDTCHPGFSAQIKMANSYLKALLNHWNISEIQGETSLREIVLSNSIVRESSERGEMAGASFLITKGHPGFVYLMQAAHPENSNLSEFSNLIWRKSQNQGFFLSSSTSISKPVRQAWLQFFESLPYPLNQGTISKRNSNIRKSLKKLISTLFPPKPRDLPKTRIVTLPSFKASEMLTLKNLFKMPKSWSILEAGCEGKTLTILLRNSGNIFGVRIGYGKNWFAHQRGFSIGYFSPDGEKAGIPSQGGAVQTSIQIKNMNFRQTKRLAEFCTFSN